MVFEVVWVKVFDDIVGLILCNFDLYKLELVVMCGVVIVVVVYFDGFY